MWFRVSSTRLPSDVARARWRALVGVTSARWGMRDRGITYGSPAYGDGHPEVGFGRTPRGALAVQVDSFERISRRGKRRCRTRMVDGHRERVCRRGKRRVARVLRDADLTVDPRPNWNAGPGYPDADEYDLETVLLHEMGHFASDARHVRRCRNSPMLIALDRGEWWHSPTDRHVNARCTAAARSSSAALGRIDHRTRQVDIVLPAGREGALAERILRRAASMDVRG